MKLPEALATDAAMIVPLALAGDLTERYDCKDGVLCAADIGKAAGISAKQASRAVKDHVRRSDEGRDDGVGAVLEIGRDLVPAPGTLTRAELAVIVARKLGLGRFRLAGEIEKRAALRPPRKERRVNAQQHPWKTGKHGRSFGPAPQGQGGIVATLSCEKPGCSATLDVRFRNLAGSTDMDRKFVQKGWEVDPARCPEHARRKGTHTMTIGKPTPAAMAGQGKMFRLLMEHFDADAGTYADGWSDKRVAEECQFTREHVAAVREEAMGPLREPPEVQQLKDDLATVEGLLAEEEGRVRSIRDMVEGLKIKAGELSKRFAG